MAGASLAPSKAYEHLGLSDEERNALATRVASHAT
jgi:hypothetical protein